MDSAGADLERFVDAQDSGGAYAAALQELHQGAKRSHWMWFVLPQVEGLGHSDMARRYAVAGLDEARAYLDHPVLGRRLLECVDALTALGGHDPVAVLGAVDAVKLRSSMTLFARAASDPALRQRFTNVLDQYFAGEEDPATVERVEPR